MSEELLVTVFVLITPCLRAHRLPGRRAPDRRVHARKVTDDATRSGDRPAAWQRLVGGGVHGMQRKEAPQSGRLAT